MEAELKGIFVGTARPLPGDGRPSAIHKEAVDRPLYLSRNGLQDDVQADLKAHGGPDRAVNQYPAEHYPDWARLFPETAERMRPGGFGENLSSAGLTEETVCVGDVFAIGDAVIQVAQPRMPCWKLGRHQGVDALPRTVVDNGRSGWLCRVLEEGEIAPGDTIRRVEAHSARLTIAALWDIHRLRRPDMEQLAIVANLRELAESWRTRFAQRLEWLRANGAEGAAS